MAITLDGTTGVTLATWTTATRPSSPVADQLGFNTTLGYIEYYNSTASQWYKLEGTPPGLSVEYLVLGGGGGGDSDCGGGGGGGGGTTKGTGGAGGSGIVIIRISSSNTATFSPGLTVTTDTSSVPGFKIYSVTAGTGYVTFS
jgi:hypothetical protein